MYDRVVRASILESARYQDLSSDSVRLLYRDLLHRADDFGNFEADFRALFNWLRPVTCIESREDLRQGCQELEDSDLLRSYNDGEKQFFHIPRFRSDRRFVSRKCPESPWDDPKMVQRLSDQRSRAEKDRKPAAGLR